MIKSQLTTNNSFIKSDCLIFTPDEVDLSYSPLRKNLSETTHVLGAFNPALCRLPSGNLLMMVRVAEALSNPVVDDKVYTIRWDAEKNYLAEAWPLGEVDTKDPRKFRINAYNFPVFALTSISWLLPVELNEDGSQINRVHYDKIISRNSPHRNTELGSTHFFY
jgi:hypothetical protein